MEIEVTDIIGEVKALKGTDLPKTGGFLGFNTSRRLTIQPTEVAIIKEGAVFTLRDPVDDRPEDVEVKQTVSLLFVPRVVEIHFELPLACFAQGAKGRVQLCGSFRIMPFEEGPHPILARMGNDLGEASLKQALGSLLDSALGSELTACLASFSYQSAAALTAFNAHLSLKQAEPNQEAQQRQIEAGLMRMRPIEALRIQAPEVDKAWRAQQAREEEERKRGEEVEAVVGSISRKSVIKSAQHKVEIIDADHHYKIEQIEQIRAIEAKKAQVVLAELEAEQAKARAAASIQKELADEQLRAERANRALAEAQAELFRTEAHQKSSAVDEAGQRLAQMEAEVAENLRRIKSLEQELFRAASRDSLIDASRQQIAALNQKLEATNDRELTMAALWRSHNDHGEVMRPDLCSEAVLPSGTNIDVVVEVNREAHVYILIKDSVDKWVTLVPDLDNMMGITRSNFQRAGERVIWPGVNRERPDLPFWALDPKTPGVERLIVAASTEPLDIENLLSERHIQQLRNMAPQPTARALCNPAKLTKNAVPEQESCMDYHRLVTGFAGQGIFFHEFVFTHDGGLKSSGSQNR